MHISESKVAYRTNNVGNVGDRRARGSTEVENLHARSNVEIVNTTKDCGGNLGSEGVPHTVLDLLTVLLRAREGKKSTKKKIANVLWPCERTSTEIRFSP